MKKQMILSAVFGVVLFGFGFANFAMAAINPIPGVDIIVRKSPGGIAIQVKTGADGTYKFTRLAPGTYDLSTAGQPPQLVIVGSDGTLGGKLMKNPDGVVALSCATGNHIKAK
jgi:hypothetical protein